MEAIKCPLCNNNIVNARLALTGLTQEELHLLHEHVKNRTLKDILNIADIALRRLDPEKISTEFQVNEAISKLRQVSEDRAEKFMNEQQHFLEKYCRATETERIQMVKEHQQNMAAMMKDFQRDIGDRTRNIEHLEKQISGIWQSIIEIKEKIVGTGIGKVAERVTIRDLKEVVPSDSFSELRASKGGADIIGTVKQNGIVFGTITVSNKCTEKWSSEFMTQLIRDMRDDGSRFGVLVSKVFPAEALSAKACVPDVEDGKSVILVRPEYAPLAYFGLRQAAIHWFETRNMLKRKEDEETEVERISRALIGWVNGEEFEITTRYIKDAIEQAQSTKQELQQVEDYIHRKVTSTLGYQQKIVEYLQEAKNVIGKLRKLLNGSYPDNPK